MAQQQPMRKTGGRQVDLTGQVFGRLTVTSEQEKSGSGESLWRCLCECGNERVAPTGNLRSGNTRSCGCLRRELTDARSRTHDMAYTRIYRAWASMIQRTTNPRQRSYPDYGGRGITVCDQWRTFDGFYADMGATYADGLTIDRIDVDGNYEPSNCRWVTRAEQSRNRRNSVRIEWRGHVLTAAEWERALGLGRDTVGRRIRQGWPVERALTQGVAPKRLAEIKSNN